jgi:hypothetical protein
MRLVSIHLFRWINEAPVMLCYEMDLNMLWFYQRGMAKEHIIFQSRYGAGKTMPGTKMSLSME